MSDQTPSTLRAQYDALAAALSARQSTIHFARTAVSVFLALVASGACGKLFWDTAQKHLWVPFAVLPVALGFFTYAAVHYLKGRKVLAGEHQRYSEMLALRSQLGLDDPGVLLPQ